MSYSLIYPTYPFHPSPFFPTTAHLPRRLLLPSSSEQGNDGWPGYGDHECIDAREVTGEPRSGAGPEAGWEQGGGEAWLGDVEQGGGEAGRAPSRAAASPRRLLPR
jgi:hypothetical protein